jgi:hypothetical protein
LLSIYVNIWEIPSSACIGKAVKNNKYNTNLIQKPSTKKRTEHSTSQGLFMPDVAIAIGLVWLLDMPR